jgi:hypothetical protein
MGGARLWGHRVALSVEFVDKCKVAIVDRLHHLTAQSDGCHASPALTYYHGTNCLWVSLAECGEIIVPQHMSHTEEQLINDRLACLFIL